MFLPLRYADGTFFGSLRRSRSHNAYVVVCLPGILSRAINHRHLSGLGLSQVSLRSLLGHSQVSLQSQSSSFWLRFLFWKVSLSLTILVIFFCVFLLIHIIIIISQPSRHSTSNLSKAVIELIDNGKTTYCIPSEPERCINFNAITPSRVKRSWGCKYNYISPR